MMCTAACSLTCKRIHPVLVSCPCMHMENNRHWTVWINLLTKVQRKGWPCCAFLFFLSLQWLIQWCPDSFNSKYQTVKRHHIIYDPHPHSPSLSRLPARPPARTHADTSSSYKMVRDNRTYLLEPPWVLVIVMMRMMISRMAVMHSATTSMPRSYLKLYWSIVLTMDQTTQLRTLTTTDALSYELCLFVNRPFIFKSKMLFYTKT